MALEQAVDRDATRQAARHAIGAQAQPRRALLVCILLGALLCFMVLLDIWMGEADVARVITPRVVLQVLGHHVPVVGRRVGLPARTPWADNIVWQMRVPRALAGVLVGALLALVGVAFQSLLMNPLADPYTVGVASGAGLGSVAVALMGGAAWLAGYAQPLAAFAAGLAAVSIVYLLARVGGRISAHTFLLAGTIVGTFFWSLIPLAITLGARADADRQALIMAALFGSLESLGWDRVGLLLPFGLFGFVLLWVYAPEMDLMAFGEETAAHLGVDAEAFKRGVVLAGTLMTAAAVAVAGIIAFVGFVVPHAARRLVGPAHRALLPSAMLLGGLLLVAADWLSRVYLHDVQVGVVTSLFGVPLFCGLMRRSLTGSAR